MPRATARCPTVQQVTAAAKPRRETRVRGTEPQQILVISMLHALEGARALTRRDEQQICEIWAIQEDAAARTRSRSARRLAPRRTL